MVAHGHKAVEGAGGIQSHANHDQQTGTAQLNAQTGEVAQNDRQHSHHSQEDGTEAGAMPNQIPDEVKQDRYHALMSLQAEISEEIQQEREGKVLEVLIEGKDEEDPNLALGRSYAEAPDIDGKIYVEEAADLKAGDFVKVRISQGFTYEAVGQIVKE